MEIKIESEVAGEDVKRWLDYKRVKPTRRVMYAGYINEMIQAVMYGDLVIEADFTITHNLNFPVTKDKSDEVLFDKLSYVPRLTAQKINECMQGGGLETNISTSIAFGAALTGKPVALIGRLDSSDLAILAAIGVFFS